MHYYEGVTYDGRSLPASFCTNGVTPDWMVESWNVTTIGGDSMIVRRVTRFPDRAPETRSARFRYGIHGSRLEAIRPGPFTSDFYWFQHGTATADGFDAQFREPKCEAPTVYGFTDTVATVHFVLRY